MCRQHSKTHNSKLEPYNENGGVKHLWNISEKLYKPNNSIIFRYGALPTGDQVDHRWHCWPPSRLGWTWWWTCKSLENHHMDKMLFMSFSCTKWYFGIPKYIILWPRNYNEPGILAVKCVALTLEMAEINLRIELQDPQAWVRSIQ